jgi:chromate transporter
VSGPPPPAERRARLREVAAVFLRLGVTGFGGPAAHIALMEDELVRRRRWVPREEFLDLLGAVNLIPGPNSTELAMHLGRVRAGRAGLWLAGACFILPAMLIVMACAWAYQRWGALPALGGVLYGVKPVVLAVVAQAVWGLGRTALKHRRLAVLGVLSAVAAWLGARELAVLLLAGVLAALPAWRPGAKGLFALPAPALLAAAGGAAGAATAAAVPVTLAGIFTFFLKIGAVLYGSGYVLLAFLRSGLVVERGWLTEAQLLDAVAVGQVTPGPVFTTATFIGWLLAGAPGAVVATAGIFLPAFLFVAVSGPLVPWLRARPAAGAFLDGVNAASLALMAVVAVQLGQAAMPDLPAGALALGALLALVRFRVNPTWLLLAGAVAGLLRGLAVTFP